MVGGIADIGTGLLLTAKTGGIGLVVAWGIIINGADNLVAGAYSMIAGEEIPSLIQSGFRRAIPNRTAADLAYMGFEIGLGYAGLRAAARARAIQQVNTGGLRNEIPLTAAQKAEAIEYAKSLGVSDDMIIVSEHMNTGYKNLFGEEKLYIGTDVLPATNPNIAKLSANSRVSMRGALAHEIIGHRAASLAGKVQRASLLEEVQASIRAARYAPGLSSTERITLIRDAIERIYPKMKIGQIKHMLWLD